MTWWQYLICVAALAVAVFAEFTRQWLRDNPGIPLDYRLSEMSWRPRDFAQHTSFPQVLASSAWAPSLTAAYYYYPGARWVVDDPRQVVALPTVPAGYRAP